MVLVDQHGTTAVTQPVQRLQTLSRKRGWWGRVHTATPVLLVHVRTLHVALMLALWRQWTQQPMCLCC